MCARAHACIPHCTLNGVVAFRPPRARAVLFSIAVFAVVKLNFAPSCSEPAALRRSDSGHAKLNTVVQRTDRNALLSCIVPHTHNTADFGSPRGYCVLHSEDGQFISLQGAHL